MSKITVRTPSKESLDVETKFMMTLAKSMVTIDDDTYISAGGQLKTIVAKKKSIEELYKATIKPIDGLFKKPLEDLKKAELNLKEKMLDYTKYKDKVKKDITEVATKEQQKEIEALKEAAKAAAEEGDVELSRQHMEEADKIPTRKVIVKTPKIKGVSLAQSWSAEVVDPAAFFESVFSGKESEDLVMANMPVLNKMAKSLKEKFAVTGVVAKKQSSLKVKATKQEK